VRITSLLSVVLLSVSFLPVDGVAIFFMAFPYSFRRPRWLLPKLGGFASRGHPRFALIEDGAPCGVLKHDYRKRADRASRVTPASSLVRPRMSAIPRNLLTNPTMKERRSPNLARRSFGLGSATSSSAAGARSPRW
jgi:hypothetical protein